MKERLYASHHSSSLKAIERLLGALFGQFSILYQPCHLTKLIDMHFVLKACAIMHNMISEERGYDGMMKFRKKLEEVESQLGRIEIELALNPGTSEQQARFWDKLIARMERKFEHQYFTQELQEHIWNISGMCVLDEEEEDVEF